MEQEIFCYIESLSNNKKIKEILQLIIKNILLKQNNLHSYIKENNDKIIHIRDWISSVIENNENWKTPRVLTIDALNNTANKYFQKKNNKIKTIELNKTHEKLIADLDNYYIVQMLTPEAFDNESKVMQHCIGHGYYDQKLKDKDYQYLSLRDKFNKAHVTLEIRNQKIIQLQGKQDKIPEEKYLEIILPWLIKNNYQNIPCLKINKFYDIETKEWIDKDDIILKKNIDYKEEIYNNLNIKHIISEKTKYFFDNNFFYNDSKNFIIINDILIINHFSNKIKENKFLKENYSFKNFNENSLINIINYLLENKFANIPWNDIGKYCENNKLVEFKNISLKENVDYIFIKQDKLEIKKGISEKFDLMYSLNKEYLKDSTYIFNDTILFNPQKGFKFLTYEKITELDINKIIKFLSQKFYKEIYMNSKIIKMSLNKELDKNDLYLSKEGYILNIDSIILDKNIDYIIDKYKDLTIKIGKTEKFNKFYNKYNYEYNNLYIDFVINNKILFFKINALDGNTLKTITTKNNFSEIYLNKNLSDKEKKQIAEYILYTNKLNISEKNKRINLFGYYLTTEKKLIKCSHMKLKKDIDYIDVSENGLNIIECISDKATSYFNYKYIYMNNIYKKGEKLRLNNELNSSYTKKYIINNNILLLYYKMSKSIFLHQKNKISIEENNKINSFIKEKFKHKNENNINLSYVDTKEISDISTNTLKLDISYSNICKLPNDLHIITLDAHHSKINNLPNNMPNINRIDLYKNKKIKELPNNLKLNFLDISQTNIKNIPENIFIKNIASLYFTKIETIPDNINPSLSLGIAFCKKLTKIPDTLKSKEIHIDENQINLIKETMKFENIHIYKIENDIIKHIKLKNNTFFYLISKNNMELFLKNNFL